MSKFDITIGYLVYGRSKYFILYSKFLFKITFGKSTKIIILDNKNIHSLDQHSNTLYEFTGYKKLIEMIFNGGYRKDDKCLIINDTLMTHHCYPLWLLGFFLMKKRFSNDDLLGDIRYQINEQYIASWLFIFPFRTIEVFNECLNDSMQLIAKNTKNYHANTVSEYACHLLQSERVRLLGWLFNKNSIRGWPHGEPFEEMPLAERYRKGLTIEIEHTLSRLLFQRIPIIDLKSCSYIFKIANLGDRLLSRLQRVYWIIRSSILRHTNTLSE